MLQTDKFGEGKYTFRLDLKALTDNYAIADDAKATVNSKDAKVTAIEGGIIRIECDFDLQKIDVDTNEIETEIDEDEKEVEEKRETEVEKVWSNSSAWAEEELKLANEKGLIPSMIKGKDFTSNITRKEFAAVAVKLYENLSGKKATAVSQNPFTDTTDREVLKAYNLGITNGTSDTTFEPDALITREQMATMMTRALTKAGTSTNIDVNAIANKFDDHTTISAWALESVYFMNARGIIKGVGYQEGVGNNCFGTKGNASRQEAIVISGRSVIEFEK